MSGSEPVAFNQSINVAVAAKFSALRDEDYFREHLEHANMARPSAFWSAGRGKPKVAGDEIAGSLAVYLSDYLTLSATPVVPAGLWRPWAWRRDGLSLVGDDTR